MGTGSYVSQASPKHITEQRITLNSQSSCSTYSVRVEKNKGYIMGIFKSLFDCHCQVERKKDGEKRWLPT